MGRNADGDKKAVWVEWGGGVGDANRWLQGLCNVYGGY